MIQKSNPFNIHLSTVGNILSEANVDYQFIDDLDMLMSGANAFANVKNRKIFLPFIDQTQIDEKEACNLRALDYHERSHLFLTDHNVIAKKEMKEDKILNSLLQFIEDSRIEGNENYNLIGDRQNLHKMSIGWHNDFLINLADAEKTAPPTILIGVGIRSYLSKLESFKFKNKDLQDIYEKAIGIIKQDGRFAQSLRAKQEGTTISFEMAKKIKDIIPEEMQKKSLKMIEDKKKEWEKFINFLMSKAIDLFKKQQEEIKKQIAAFSDGTGKNGPYIPYIKDDKTIKPDYREYSYKTSYLGIVRSISFLKTFLADKLLQKSYTKIIQDQTVGDLNEMAIWRLPLGERNLFEVTCPGKELSAAVQIVIDNSGSMIYESRIELAMQICMVLGEVLNQLNLPFEIIGFNSSWRHNSLPPMIKKNYTRTDEIINRYVYKSFDEQYHKVKYRIGAMSADGGTIMHEVLLWGAARLWARESKRKIQFVLTDGEPCASGFSSKFMEFITKQMNEKITKAGIEQYAFGINTDYVRNTFEHYAVIKDIKSIQFAALRQLGVALLNGQNKYV